ncbi:uncharacterized protein LOC110856877 isoform X3 [Folsomia candida]|uniref:uncharacterized protein LOC110856877 isoform X3 n=1 Tax=Folsomia candida TaxID=158441 RepID=UPI000B8F0056|nr:uncharacterized protein LOC110856877 isoform X3 [Folsomia candida]
MWWFPVSPRRFCPSVGGVTLIFLLLAVCLATGGIHVPVKIQDKDADATLKGIQAPIPLPTNFEERLSTEMRMTTAEKSRRMGDPAPIYRDKDSHTRGEDQARALGRQARGFFSFWPFSIEITKGKGADHHPGGGGGWGPSHYGSHKGPSTGFHFNKGITFKAGSHLKGHHEGGGHGGGHQQHGWGWEASIEKEKHQLRYEILKLKAKKKIALLQNTVELKKLFSIILQKIVQALEWWR